MEKILELRRQIAALVAELRAMNDKAEQEKRALTEDETKNYTKIKADIDNLRSQEQRLLELHDLEDELRNNSNSTPPAGNPGDNNVDFRTFGEFLQTARFNPRDPALQTRDLAMGVGAQGGIIVPEQFDKNIRMVDDRGAWFRPRAQVIPAGDPPDAAITIPALDQSGANGVYAGVNVTWIGEGDRKPQTEPSFMDIKLEPHEVAAHVVITDKLLRNAPAAGALVQNLLRKAIVASEQNEFYMGNGIGKPLGIIGHASAITINRAVANQIAYADVVAMYARLKMGGSPGWIASQTTLPQLMTMVDAGNNLVWQPNARDGAPGTLLGLPVYINDQSPVLGVEGDLALVDLDYYLIKDGSGIAIAMSEHVFFRDNKTVIKAFWNVDGQPWLTTPMLQRDGVSTVSPFVVLR